MMLTTQYFKIELSNHYYLNHTIIKTTHLSVEIWSISKIVDSRLMFKFIKQKIKNYYFNKCRL